MLDARLLNARLLGVTLTILPLWLGACASDAESGDLEGDVEGDGDDSGDGDGGDCPSEIVQMPAAPGCAAATQTCVDACETDECWDTCLAADPDPEACGGCLDDAYVACGNQMGCQPEWDAMLCCFDRCADPESAECETSCAVEVGTFDTCLETFDDACSEASGSTCFPS